MTAVTASSPTDVVRPMERSRAVRLGVLTRLYVWSVVLEPLLVFALFNATTTGVTGNLSKALQVLVVVGLALTLLSRYLERGLEAVRLLTFSNPAFSSFRTYFALCVLAGLVGIFSGAYRLPYAYAFAYTEFTGFATFLNSPNVRPVLEYFILLYYFVYFVVLPRYLLNNRRKVEYFLSTFKKLFILSFVLGVIDLAASFAGMSLIPRHFADDTFVASGGRFHGLAGEPRDAFVYLFFGLAILHLDAYYRQKRLSKYWVIAIVAAAIATQSTSGLVGILIFVSLYLVHSLTRLSRRAVLLLLGVVCVSALLIYITVTTSENVSRYLEAAAGLWQILESGSEIPYLMAVQMVNIYPLYDLTVKFRGGDLLPILIGSGLGSASAINNFIPGLEFTNLANPHSQIARVIYENGLIGTWVFLRMFTRPVRRISTSLSSKQRQEFMLLMLLVLGCSLGQRSSALFIYLGIFIATFHVLQRA